MDDRTEVDFALAVTDRAAEMFVLSCIAWALTTRNEYIRSLHLENGTVVKTTEDWISYSDKLIKLAFLKVCFGAVR